ncbi:MAG: exodeoxyribonuclease VII large subunit [Candidatus Ryanbacteria bacterium CG10_big_fil_rev_8_21_14_0_10_43_42]|uniref:Exodeoxyribonuclease 7 large subunit n=1 Tax=Candidatus Ryanbacteria bacterium CG10_big_fil_rev_8_21_14_0_10_43_42 TaxID=1974864 RepID=A0A2M8KWT4_9BACT|nr:MAG: exodeoxyribonuclease VII large subunit [Candidatus Ryanbacteria bacterium CG10_big_fil_rev_8_21_14_0_10_43_42]
MTRSELLQKLKEKRKEIAEREGKELFMVFQNKALEETVKAMPQTREDLKLVKGWGKVKISRYGDEILSIFKQGNGKHEDTYATGGLFNNPIPAAESPSGGEGKQSHDNAVLSVSEFIEVVNITLSRLGLVRVQGEISEMQMRGAAVYFTLKDTSGEDAIVKCLLWKWQFEQQYDYLEDGLEIIIEGVPDVFVKYGTFSVKVSRVEPVGEGALRKAFEALKKKFEMAGYFDEARKRPLPRIIQRIGVVTSASGEAINDFRRNIGDYGLEICMVDVRVEGVYAEDSIVKGIQWLNTHHADLDVLVLIRGGGGLENLKAFNSERVAEAVLGSRLPVITGIGHERDDTIAGFIADINCSTPTAVAVYIRHIREDLIGEVNEKVERLIRLFDVIYETALRSLHERKTGLIISYTHILSRYRHDIASHTRALQTGLFQIFSGFRLLTEQFRSSFHRYESILREYYRTVEINAVKGVRILERSMQEYEKRISVTETALASLDPAAPLKRGYSITYGSDGRVLKNAKNVTIGERISVHLYEGNIGARIEENIQPEK